MRRSLITGVRVALVALAVAGLAPAGCPAAPRPAHPGAVVVGHAGLEVPCGPGGTRLSTDWYLPGSGSRRPTGIAWVQHGFFQTRRNIAGLAGYIAAHAGAIVVAPTMSSNPFAAGGCWINGAPMQRAVAELFAERSALQRSADAAKGGHVSLPRAFVLSGHSAGGNLATAAAGDTTLPGGAIAELRAVVLYDAVDSGGAMEEALNRLTGDEDRPVLDITSPPSACNALGRGSRALVSARPGRFVGVQLVGGTHLDAEGPDSGPLARAVCGRPTQANVRALRSIASDWITNALTGSSMGIVDGTAGDEIPVDGATAIVLPTR